ncbi:hypothetical protein [Compostimonas suwonensis]|uniref:Uncharacterized protein n=1 Tax=Compostimonas suwonensis TaxID=1048394 RepID=A0A2M9BBA1_9MICO|nr:hypothetical protein [Compostimonas suwonensis]PJJ55220.1 hypothetical protein CLV54_3357 [Compostimonas suwonensis]
MTSTPYQCPPPWWARVRLQLFRIVVIGVVTGALWLPWLLHLPDPDRHLLGSAGRLVVIVSGVIQIVALVVGLVFVGLMREWTDEVGRRAARVWGWLAFVAGIPFVVIAGSTFVAGVRPELPAGVKWVVFLLMLASVLAPALLSPRRAGLLAIIGTLLAVLAIALAAPMAIGAGSVLIFGPVVIGPATAYAVAVSLHVSEAGFARI